MLEARRGHRLELQFRRRKIHGYAIGEEQREVTLPVGTEETTTLTWAVCTHSQESEGKGNAGSNSPRSRNIFRRGGILYTNPLLRLFSLQHTPGHSNQVSHLHIGPRPFKFRLMMVTIVLFTPSSSPRIRIAQRDSGNFHAALKKRAFVMKSSHTHSRRNTNHLTVLPALGLHFWTFFYALVGSPVPAFNLSTSKTLLASSGIPEVWLPGVALGNPISDQLQSQDIIPVFRINKPVFLSKFIGAYPPDLYPFSFSPNQNRSVVEAVSLRAVSLAKRVARLPKLSYLSETFN